MTIPITIKCIAGSCFNQATWEDEEPKIASDGTWTVTRKPPPPGWRLARAIPVRASYDGPNLTTGHGLCPRCAPSDRTGFHTLP